MSSEHNICMDCGKRLVPDEKAIFMKLVDRTASRFLCLDCLSAKLGCARAELEKRIRYYRESGNCVLFR